MELLSSEKKIHFRPGLLAFLLVIYPALVAYKISGIQAIFSGFEGDTFYYLAIAKHHGWQPLFSFDTIWATNGFHPLWQWFLKLSFLLPALQGNMEWQLQYTFIVSTLVVATAAAILANTIYWMIKSFSLSLLAVVPGFLYWIVSSLMPLHGTIWSFNNGMESPFSLLFFSGFFYYAISRNIFVSGSASHYFVLSIFLTFIIFARLDDVFLLPMVVIAVFYANRPRWLVGMQKALIVCIFPSVSVLGYLLLNEAYAGSAMPISGMEKSGFSLHRMIVQAIDSIFPFLQLVSGRWGFWEHLSLRAFLNLVPLIIAVTWILRLFKIKEGNITLGNTDILLACLCGYVVCKGGYNACFVFIWHQGPWYYPISIVIANILIAIVLRDMAFPAVAAGTYGFGRIKIAVVLLVLFTGNCFTFQKNKNFFEPNYLLWSNRKHIDHEVLANYQGKGILSFDDGILAYCLERPVMSGFGFALDIEASKAKHEGKLFQLAYDRGFRLMGPNIGYGPELPGVIGLDVSEQIRKANYAIGQDLDGWVFSIRYIDPVTRFKFVEFSPREKSE